MTSTRDLIERLGMAEAALLRTTILAPLVRGGRARTRVAGLVYELRVRHPSPGWYQLRARDARRAEVVADAEPWARDQYLNLWPLLRLVLIEPIADPANQAWIAMPYNPADALQRFGQSGPVVVQLVEQGMPFERIIGRVEGQAIWYDQPDRRANPQIAEDLRFCMLSGAADPQVANLSPGERAAYAMLIQRRMQANQQTAEAMLERRLQHALEIGGARLVGYTIEQDQLRVIWQHAGMHHIAFVSHALDVVSAGICLSGRDAQFDLSSLVGVVADAPDFARFSAAEW